MDANYNLFSNPYSWHQQADVFYIDQPVGTGFSTADSDGGYVVDEGQVASDFIGFLKNLVKVFPSVATRPVYLVGKTAFARLL
jgi:carboxypeptidase D